MTDSIHLLAEIEEYIIATLTEKLPSEIIYHSVQHTKDVVASSLEIGSKEKISDSDLEILQIAAWFHDVGYTRSCGNHESSSAAMAFEFLSERNYPEADIAKVKDCIMATQMPQEPKNELGEIICDADMLHLASDDYFQKAELLHDEMEKIQSCKISTHEWLLMNQDFLKRHAFFTNYASVHYAPLVKENLKKIDARLAKIK